MRIQLLIAVLLAASAPLAIAEKTATHRAGHHNIRHKATHSLASRTRSGGIDSERATQIQSALIKQGYLNGQPSGTWDSRTVAAMQKLQADNGWQTKLTPDARALNKLGLGPQPNPAP
jgi:hypothetical protein